MKGRSDWLPMRTGDLVLGVVRAPWADVDAHDLRMGAEIAFPHLERAAVASDLDHGRGAVHVAGEVPLIGREVVFPLMDWAAGVAKVLRPETHAAPRCGTTAVVELRGIEPLTSSLRTRRSTN